MQAPDATLGTPPQGVLPTHAGVGLGADRTTEVEPSRHEDSGSLSLEVELEDHFGLYLRKRHAAVRDDPGYVPIKI